MNTISQPLRGSSGLLALLQIWWPVVLGLAVLYVPTYWMLAHGIWNSEEQAHGPIVLVVALYLVWQQRAVFLADAPTTISSSNRLAGWILLVFGLLMYALGRSQDIILFEVGSQIPVILGTLLVTRGLRAAKSLWFAIFFWCS
jgi:Transmembrane exosortase (Exosortase_EpsH).